MAYRKVKLIKPKNTLGATSQGDGKPWGLSHWILSNVLPRPQFYRSKVDLEQVAALTKIFSDAEVLESQITDTRDAYVFLSEGQWEWLVARMEPDSASTPGGVAKHAQAHLASILIQVHIAEQINEDRLKELVDEQKRAFGGEQVSEG